MASRPIGDLGRSVSNIGDINGDGFEDLILGAPAEYGSYAFNFEDRQGLGFVILGSGEGFDSQINIPENDSSDGFLVVDSVTPKVPVESANSSLGTSVSGGGDINGDGFDDFVISSSRIPVTYNGEAYVIFGKSSNAEVIETDTLIGNNGRDVLVGNAGNDVIFGGDGNDTIFGGDGNDTLMGDRGSDTFELTRGGNIGTDIIKGYQDGVDNFLLTDRFDLGTLRFSDLSLGQNGSNVEIKITTNNQLLAIVENNNVADFDINDFVTG